MATWEVAFGSTVAGALAGGAGSVVAGRWAARYDRTRDARRKVLEETLPVLVSAEADRYHSGTYRGTLIIHLSQLEALSTLAGRHVKKRSAALAEAWNEAVLGEPPTLEYTEAPIVSADRLRAIDDAHGTLSRYVQRLMAPWWSRWPSPVKWPETDVRGSSEESR